jgi:hypothetical protein
MSDFLVVLAQEFTCIAIALHSGRQKFFFKDVIIYQLMCHVVAVQLENPVIAERLILSLPLSLENAFGLTLQISKEQVRVAAVVLRSFITLGHYLVVHKHELALDAEVDARRDH